MVNEASTSPSASIYNDHLVISHTPKSEVIDMLVKEIKDLKKFIEPLKDAYKF